jgi:hypothetical protein
MTSRIDGLAGTAAVPREDFLTSQSRARSAATRWPERALVGDALGQGGSPASTHDRARQLVKPVHSVLSWHRAVALA